MSLALLLLYQCIVSLAVLVALPYLLVRALRHPREMKERIGLADFYPRTPGGRRAQGRASSTGSASDPAPLWLHAASLGELEAVRALLEDPAGRVALPLVLTVTSVSARVRAEGIAAGMRVSFAPLDLWAFVLLFLRRARPRGLVLVETELWPLTLALCHARGLPVTLISGRISPRKWRRTRRLRPLLAPLIARLDGCAAQSEADAERFRFLGARDVRVTGNLKYRLERDPAAERTGTRSNAGDASHEAAPAFFLFVAGSVRLGEEGVIAAAPPGCLTVIAPRHLREREHWLKACEAAGRGVIARTAIALDVPTAAAVRAPEARRAFRARVREAWPRGSDGGSPILLLDVHGELGSWFASSDAAFVGGSLVPIGGHNLFEPAREGIPVAFGPHTEGVSDLAEPLLRLGGGVVVSGAEELTSWLTRLMADPGARRTAGEGAWRAAEQVAGAAGRTWSFLRGLGWPGVENAEPCAPAAGRSVAGRGDPEGTGVPEERRLQ